MDQPKKKRVRKQEVRVVRTNEIPGKIKILEAQLNQYKKEQEEFEKPENAHKNINKHGHSRDFIKINIKSLTGQVGVWKQKLTQS